MRRWREATEQECDEIRHKDSIVAAYLTDEALLFVSEGGHAIVYPEQPQRYEILLSGDSSCDVSRDIPELIEMSARKGCTVYWVGADDWIPGDLDQPWTFLTRWVWMSTTKVVDHRYRWPLVELDDARDGEEIQRFGMEHNPRFEGDAGQGRTRMWFGVRDEQSRLIGCGGVHSTNAGLGNLGGLVVHEQMRGQQIGTDLLVALTRWSIEMDKISTLSAFADNERAIKLYESMGYRLEHRFRFWELIPRRG